MATAAASERSVGLFYSWPTLPDLFPVRSSPTPRGVTVSSACLCTRHRAVIRPRDGSPSATKVVHLLRVVVLVVIIIKFSIP